MFLLPFRRGHWLRGSVASCQLWKVLVSIAECSRAQKLTQVCSASGHYAAMAMHHVTAANFHLCRGVSSETKVRSQLQSFGVDALFCSLSSSRMSSLCPSLS